MLLNCKSKQFAEICISSYTNEYKHVIALDLTVQHICVNCQRCLDSVPIQVAACRAKWTVSRHTVHLAALMLRPWVNRCGVL